MLLTPTNYFLFPRLKSRLYCRALCSLPLLLPSTLTHPPTCILSRFKLFLMLQISFKTSSQYKLFLQSILQLTVVFISCSSPSHSFGFTFDASFLFLKQARRAVILGHLHLFPLPGMLSQMLALPSDLFAKSPSLWMPSLTPYVNF